MSYFLYKPQNISNMGNIFPNYDQDNSGIQLGLAFKRGYYLGYIDSPEKIKEMKNYFVCFIDDEIAEGFKLLDVEKVVVETNGFQLKRRDLTDEEREKQKKAEKLLMKLELRDKINANIEDVEDIIADINKRIDLIERLIVTVCKYLLRNEQIPEDVSNEFLPFINRYFEMLDNNEFMTRVDIEDATQLFEKLSSRITKITKLVQDEYLNK